MEAGVAAATAAVRDNNSEKLGVFVTALKGNGKSVADMTRQLASQDAAFGAKVQQAGATFSQTGQVPRDVQQQLIKDVGPAEKRGAFK